MKKIWLIFIGLLFLGACSTDGTSGKIYEFVQDGHGGPEWLLPNSYQITIDDSFELVSKYVIESSDSHMYFWHAHLASEYPFELDTTRDDLEENVPTIEISPVNKHQYIYMENYMSFDLTETEAQEIMDEVKQEVENKSEVYLEEMKEKSMGNLEADPTVYTNEEYDIDPFTYMIESELKQGVIHYELFGEAEKDYIRATLSLTSKVDKELFEKMLDSLRTITYK
ncbi:hypothetical protein [Alkalihalobacterium alkalinitrilicum]|uniref:hypothetical protein n=1 Tax=Alkalihalobacterium alkalinitrilicum TaxID=427920 RepID=UPI000995662F|nr:hypothetical protein [Alkalihalobacterium alkalinitrilicum]